jgi:hypothetical protein
MKSVSIKLLLGTVLFIGFAILSGCASMKYGDKSAEDNLKRFQSVPGKVSLYVCRENALFVAAGVRSEVIVDNDPIGTLKPNTFAHVVLDPGKHDVFLKNDGIAFNSGHISIEPKADDVAFLWVGMTGHGFGTLTIDFFDDIQNAKNCVNAAKYSIKAQ